jgi:hypothetical protein
MCMHCSTCQVFAACLVCCGELCRICPKLHPLLIWCCIAAPQLHVMHSYSQHMAAEQSPNNCPCCTANFRIRFKSYPVVKSPKHIWSVCLLTGKTIHRQHHETPYFHVSLDPPGLILSVMAAAALLFGLLFQWGPLSLTATAAYYSAGADSNPCVLPMPMLVQLAAYCSWATTCDSSCASW